MNLPRILLPQAVNGVITTSSIYADGGVLAFIPRYADVESGNVVRVYVNEILYRVIAIYNPTDLPYTVSIPIDRVNIDAMNRIYYEVIANSENVYVSPIENFFVLAGSQITLFLETTSGAQANGIATNLATVSLSANGIPQSAQAVTLTIIGPAFFSNNQSTITVITDGTGKAQAAFSSNTVGSVTIRAQYLTVTQEAPSSFSAVAPTASLSSTVLNNNIPAGDVIYIQYQLLNANGTPISGAAISLSSPDAPIHLTASPVYTLSNGIANVGVQSSQSGTFTVNAVANTTPLLSNSTSVNFTAPSTYTLSATVTQNGAVANGTATNMVRFFLLNTSNNTPAAGRVINVTTTAPWSYPSSVTTDSSGYAYLNVTSTLAGSYTATAYLSDVPSTTATFSLNFTSNANNGVLVGSEYLWIGGNISLDEYLKNYQIIMGHRYKLVSNRPASSVGNCGNSYVFNTAQRACIKTYGNSYTFYNQDLYEFRALYTGSGANMFTFRYHVFNSNNYGWAYVELWDFGSADAFSSDAPLLLTDRSEQAQLEDDVNAINDVIEYASETLNSSSGRPY